MTKCDLIVIILARMSGVIIKFVSGKTRLLAMESLKEALKLPDGENPMHVRYDRIGKR